MKTGEFDSSTRAPKTLAVLLALSTAFYPAVSLVAQETRASAMSGFPTDWSHSHLIFTDLGSSQAPAGQDPRAQMQWLRENRPLLRQRLPQNSSDGGSKAGPEWPWPPQPPVHKPAHGYRTDWNFSLDTARTNSGVPPNRYPAKYSFAPNGTANCTTDFVIYGMDLNGSASQANLVGVNNLYVGTTGACGTIANGGGSGPVPTPHVQWAYDDPAGPITSSVTLNLTGTKVAYVVDSSPAAVRVVTLGAGTGAVESPTDVTSTNPATVNLQNTVSNSSIFVDYAHDIGWVGDDDGILYKITSIFNGTPTLAAVLTTDGTRCSGNDCMMTSPVYDSTTDTVFVGSEDGFIYGYTNASGTPVALSGSIQLALANPGIIAPPIVDSTNHILYAFYPEDPTNDEGQVAQVIYTANPTFSASPTSSLTTAGTNRVAFANGNPNIDDVSAGAFSRSYFNGFSPDTSFLYTCGPNSRVRPIGIALQQAGFDSNRILSGAITVVATLDNSLNLNNTEYCSPITHFFNAGTGIDYLFLSAPPLDEVVSFDITNNTAGGALSPVAMATISGGTSGIIVDGADPSNQASSVYFTSLASGTNACTISSGSPAGNVANPANPAIGNQEDGLCAYKLTQSGLQ